MSTSGALATDSAILSKQFRKSDFGPVEVCHQYKVMMAKDRFHVHKNSSSFPSRDWQAMYNPDNSKAQPFVKALI
jgi:hypothetical protein